MILINALLSRENQKLHDRDQLDAIGSGISLDLVVLVVSGDDDDDDGGYPPRLP